MTEATRLPLRELADFIASASSQDDLVTVQIPIDQRPDVVSALHAASKAQEPVAWPEPKVTNPDIAAPTGVPYIDGLLHQLLDAQQDINYASNEGMDQSLADAASLIDEVEEAIRKLTLALYAHPPATSAEREWQPIETAPRDGRKILYWNKFNEIGHCIWCEAASAREVSCWWDEEKDDEVAPLWWRPSLSSPRPLYAAPIQSSAPVVCSSLPSGESDPSVMPDSAGADPVRGRTDREGGWNAGRELSSPSEPIAQGQREAIARIIDPGSFKYHRDMIEAGIADGMTPIAALEQAHRACRSTIPEALAKADAILATLSQEPVKLMEGMHYVTRGNKNNLRQFVGPLVASGDDEFPWRSGDHHWRADGTSAESKVRDIVSDPVYPPLATLPQPPVGACREALDLLQMQQRGRARALRILDASRAVSDPATLAQADAYEECGNELLAALAPSAQEGETLETLIREYARDLRRNSSGGDDYPWEWAKATADYLEVLIERASPHSRPDRSGGSS